MKSKVFIKGEITIKKPNASRQAKLSTTCLLLLAITLALLVAHTAFSSTRSHIEYEPQPFLTIDSFHIELHSDEQLHTALKESNFVLSGLNPDGDSLQLIEPLITLSMLYMDCGTVTSRFQRQALDRYSVNAAPLMKGAWVATATFKLEGYGEQSFQLSVPFDVQ